MMPGMNPRKMQQMMKRMGIQQQDIEAIEVIIRTPDKNLIIANPSVAKVNMMGQESFQISGEVHVEEKEQESTEISEEDVKTVMEQAQVDEDKAKAALEASNGDIAEAILSLQEAE